MANNKRKCFTCDREKNTYTCEGCSKRFCFIHIPEHHQRLNEELHHIVDNYNEFKERINKQKKSSQNYSLIQQIDRWEEVSIEKIKQKAKDCRKMVIGSLQTYINDIETKFNNLNKQIQQLQIQNDFNEINLIYLRNQLRTITEELNNPLNISIPEDPQSFINEISIILSKKPKFNKWKQDAIIVAGGNGEGEKLNQLYHPEGIFIDKQKNIFIADRFNHRIVEWKCNAKEGQTVAGGNELGNRMDQLNYPTDIIVDQQNYSIIIADWQNRRVIQWLNQKQQILINNIDCSRLAMDEYGFLYANDYKKNEVRRWKMGEYNEGIVVAGGNGQGNQLNQLNSPTFIFVDEHQSVYVSDGSNHRVMKWRKDATEGRIVAGGNGKGRNLNQLSSPEGLIVDNFGRIYISDFGNHRIVRWCEQKEEGEVVVGGNGEGIQLNSPGGLSFDDEGNLYIGNYINHRITKFEIIL
ncbi:unnamed protein product [Adineta steineri]|uniref:Uncharacterized protein n=1 Tax=Adineta steineri TaxID=433720 RepID=A0A819UWY4_9BILA|nr:unnamed protein product [Adineta steineri]CAF4099641.1 unnamed protein product [Adineta steineri]